MDQATTTINPTEPATDEAAILSGYGCGTLRFAGAPDALYERHLKFDNVVEPASADQRERYEAAGRAVRDILSDRWLRTDETYARENPKRVYYVSIEFLIGRSLANNVMNLMLDPVVSKTFDEHGRFWMELLDEEPDAGLGNGGLGRLAACFLDSMATMALPAMGYGLRYEHGIFQQAFRNGWQEEKPDNWLKHPDPWEVVRPAESVEIKLGCTMELRGGTLRFVPNQPSTLMGVPYDRPVVGYGGKTINTLRLWSASAMHSFDFQRFSEGDFVASMAETLGAESLTRVLYPDDSTPQGRELRLMQEYFLVACSLADLVRRFRETNDDWRTLPEKAAIQLNDTHPSLAVPELMRILIDGAGLSWDEAWDVTKRTLAYTNHTLLPEALERWPVDWLRLDLAAPGRDHLRDQQAPARRRPRPLSRRPRPRRARQPDRGRPRAAGAHGQSRHRRLAQHQRRRGDPFAPPAHGDGQRPRRGVSRPLQQQDERRHAAALDEARQPVARRDDHRRRSATTGSPISRNCSGSSRSPRMPPSAPTSTTPSAPARRASPTG